MTRRTTDATAVADKILALGSNFKRWI